MNCWTSQALEILSRSKDTIDEKMSDLEFARLRSLSKPVFRRLPFWRDFQQRENTTGLSRSSGANDSQDEPSSASLTSVPTLPLTYFRWPSRDWRCRRKDQRIWRLHQSHQRWARDRNCALPQLSPEGRAKDPRLLECSLCLRVSHSISRSDDVFRRGSTPAFKWANRRRRRLRSSGGRKLSPC